MARGRGGCARRGRHGRRAVHTVARVDRARGRAAPQEAVEGLQGSRALSLGRSEGGLEGCPRAEIGNRTHVQEASVGLRTGFRERRGRQYGKDSGW